MVVNLRASGGEAVNLVVVSNRVARGKASEPMTGGLAAALLPVVEKSGAIWVGSSGRVGAGRQKDRLAKFEGLVQARWRCWICRPRITADITKALQIRHCGR